MSIPTEKIEAIRAQTDIAQWIGARVKLRKSGGNFVGLCPFHQEKSPSFSVSATKNMYYCFGCHVGGDVFDFVMRYDRLDFAQAARKLAEQTTVILEEESSAHREKRLLHQAIVQINRAAHAYFMALLWSHEGRRAQDYLKHRGLSVQAAHANALGFGGKAAAFDQHMQQLRAQHNWPEAAWQASGLWSQNDQKSWPLLTERLIFPIHNVDNQLVGFGGRRLPPDTHGPKYINSRDGVLFNKRHLLYGLPHAQDAIRRHEQIVLVEGYMDVLAARAADVHQAVAAMGTALTAEHAALCRRLSPTVVMLMDSDAAGERAAYKACLLMFHAKLQVRLAQMPAGMDPDSLLQKHGAQRLRQIIHAAKPAVEMFFDKAFAEPQMGVEKRVEGAKLLMPLIQALPSGLERDLYTSRLADAVGTSSDKLRQYLHVAKAAPAAARPASGPMPPSRGPETPVAVGAATAPLVASASKAAATRSSSKMNLMELDIIRELLLFPDLRNRWVELAEYMLIPENATLLEALSSSEQPIADILTQHIPDRLQLQRLLQVQPQKSVSQDASNLQANRSFESILGRLKYRHLDLTLAEVLQEIKQAETQGAETTALIRRKQELVTRKQTLRKNQAIVGIRA